VRVLKSFLAAVALAALGSGGATAQEWPARPVTMVVPFAAGGPVDVLGRVLQSHLGEALGQPVIVENAPGAGGTTGALRVARAAPDSHLFLLGSVGTHAIGQSMHRKPAYHALADFQPVMLVADAPLVLLVRRDLAASNLGEFIAYARAHQAAMQYGSAGAGTSTHVGCVLLNQSIGADIVHVPYRGGGPALQDLIAGRIDYLCNYVSISLSVARSGQGKVLATLARTRASAFPDVPTADEQGLKDFDVSAWNAIFLPKSAPPAVVAKLHAAASQALDRPALRARLEDLGLIAAAPERRSPEYLHRFVEAEIAKWAGPVKASGIVED
jgi:tripartite-type tricarboxylate transporter receptor subunit TctC